MKKIISMLIATSLILILIISGCTVRKTGMADFMGGPSVSTTTTTTTTTEATAEPATEATAEPTNEPTADGSQDDGVGLGFGGSAPPGTVYSGANYDRMVSFQPAAATFPIQLPLDCVDLNPYECACHITPFGNPVPYYPGTLNLCDQRDPCDGEPTRPCPDGQVMRPDPRDGCRAPECDVEMPRPIACTTDVRRCSDGSSVGRDPNNYCQFRPCPNVKKCADDRLEFAPGLFLVRGPNLGCQFPQPPFQPPICTHIYVPRCNPITEMLGKTSNPCYFECVPQDPRADPRCMNRLMNCHGKPVLMNPVTCSVDCLPGVGQPVRRPQEPGVYCKEEAKKCPDKKTWVKRNPQTGCQWLPCPPSIECHPQEMICPGGIRVRPDEYCNFPRPPRVICPNSLNCPVGFVRDPDLFDELIHKFYRRSDDFFGCITPILIVA